MPMPPDDLVEAYERTDYRVRLARGGYAAIRVGKPLPQALQAVLPEADAPWGFITAWNPDSRSRPRKANRAAQRQLLDALRKQASAASIRAGMGVAADVDADGRRWREPSLFVADVPFDLLDTLMLRFGQVAIIRGAGTSPAQLRWADLPGKTGPDRDRNPPRGTGE